MNMRRLWCKYFVWKYQLAIVQERSGLIEAVKSAENKL